MIVSVSCVGLLSRVVDVLLPRVSGLSTAAMRGLDLDLGMVKTCKINENYQIKYFAIESNTDVASDKTAIISTEYDLNGER